MTASAPDVRPGPVRPPVTWQRRVLTGLGVFIAALTVAAGAFIEFDPSTLVEGAGDVANLIERMLPPRLDEPAHILALTGETILMALLGTVMAAVLSVPLAFLAARTTTPHPLVGAVARGVIVFCRAMPDLVFAVLFVRALGIGVLPGILALGLHSVGMLGKLFADAVERADPGSREAMRSVGAGAVTQLLGGVVPHVVPAWVSAFVYRIDINLRISVVLGFVGAGGIGFALQDALRGLVYPKALGIVLVILAAIAVLEVLSVGIRRTLLQPAAWDFRRDRTVRFSLAALLVAAVVYAMVQLQVNPVTVAHSAADLVEVFGRLLPPDFTRLGDRLAAAMVETIAIALVATAIGVVLSVPLGVLAARNAAPHPAVYVTARTVILFVRAIPELVLAVVFVAAVGLGPIAGACALGIGSIGFLGKLVADAVEEVPAGPAEAVRSVGGGWWKVHAAAVLPTAMPAMIGSVLYLLDVNIRTSTILGVVGAGGVGFLLFESVRTLNFEVTGAIIIVVFAVVFVIERISGWVRAQLT